MSIGNIKSNLASVLFIPYWVAEAIQRHGLSLSDIVDYEKIRPALSMHDMATLVAMQYETGNLLYARSGNDVIPRSDLETVWRHLTAAWPADPAPYAPGKVPSAQYQQLISYSGDPTVTGDVVSRLYGQAAKLDRYDHAFDAVQLGPQVAGIVIYPGYFNRPMTDHHLQHQLIKALLQVFYVQGASYDEIASTPLFKRHLELLSGE